MTGHAINSICVFCGSSANAAAPYFEAARLLGMELARRKLTLVYGGAHVGLMGALADAALAAGGRVTGVIPRALVEKEVAHVGLTELHAVESMHDRKALMNELSDAFITLPGGFGTMDELFETLTWAQLRFHSKPVGLLNVKGYFDALLAFADRAVADGFIHAAHREMILAATEPGELIGRMAAFRFDDPGKWWRRG